MAASARSADATEQLLRGLNEDLRGEFQAVIMYRLYASMVQGPYRQELRAFFANEIPEELAHAQILADRTEFCPVLSPDGRYLYFTSDRSFADKPLEAALSTREWNARLDGPGNGRGDTWRVPMSAVF